MAQGLCGKIEEPCYCAAHKKKAKVGARLSWSVGHGGRLCGGLTAIAAAAVGLNIGGCG